jgi:deoxyribodipyrimidine photo-lyase
MTLPENKPPIIVWFRNDLRTSDHAALYNASKDGSPIIPVFIYDKANMGNWDYGAAQKYWLHYSLLSLKNDLPNLVLRQGDTLINLLQIARASCAKAIYALRNYEPWATDIESQLHDIVQSEGIEFKRFSGNLLVEPEKLKNKSGNDFQIYTPFFKSLFVSNLVRKPLPKPHIRACVHGIESDNLANWDLLPKAPNWAFGFNSKVGESAASSRFAEFIGRIEDYSNGRDIPAQNSTSFLSPHIRFGEISPAQIWAKIHEVCPNPTGNYYKFLAELGWREFSYHLLLRLPSMPERPMKSKFEDFPWERDLKNLRAWQLGQTGYPIVDAGMRQLWQTGYMHNRVRMIVASFLVKHLMIPWQDGAKWFWDCLLDGDLANNSASWQWVAGCGMDAAPFFRIFNPILQGQKFDSSGEYVKKWLPELAQLPNEFIHCPFDAPSEILARAGVKLGQSYPNPIVDHNFARQRALEGLKFISA